MATHTVQVNIMELWGGFTYLCMHSNLTIDDPTMYSQNINIDFNAQGSKDSTIS